MMKSHTGFALLAGLVLVLAPPSRAAAQDTESWSHVSVLEREYPELYEMTVRLERAHGLLFGQLLAEGEAVRATGADVTTFGFELDMVERLTAMVGEDGTADNDAAEAEAGYAVLGKRAAEVIARTHAFYREVLGTLVDASVTDRRAAVDEAVQRYLSRPDVALPGAAKDMDVLYDHPYALAFRTGYADLDGLIWAGHWLTLAATEPLTDFAGRDERVAGLDTITNRFFAKLSYGEPPEFFPSELPLMPAIAPGIIFLHPQVAMIWDNLNMMQEVLADVLASPEVTDVRAALDEAIDHFLDPSYRMTDQADWEIMALRHGIFFQGGYPLAVMTQSERNVGGHAAHLGGGVPIISGMP
jgi:hypothetical protein